MTAYPKSITHDIFPSPSSNQTMPPNVLASRRRPRSRLSQITNTRLAFSTALFLSRPSDIHPAQAPSLPSPSVSSFYAFVQRSHNSCNISFSLARLSTITKFSGHTTNTFLSGFHPNTEESCAKNLTSSSFCGGKNSSSTHRSSCYLPSVIESCHELEKTKFSSSTYTETLPSITCIGQNYSDDKTTPEYGLKIVGSLPTEMSPNRTIGLLDDASDRGNVAKSASTASKGESDSSQHSIELHQDMSGDQPELLERMAYFNNDENLWKAFIDDVHSGRIQIKVSTFAAVVASLTRHRRIDKALSVLRLAEKGPLSEAVSDRRSVKLFTMMIDIYGKSYQLSRAFSLFYGMARNNTKPNVVTYNAMIAACSRSNEPDLAYEVFEEMQANGLTADKFTYGALIDSFAKSGQVERAFEMSELMDTNNVPKDQTIYSALMDACGRTEQLERALTVFEEMKQKGVWPNLVTFSVLIDICANAREPERAFQLYSELKHWGYPIGNVIVFTSLIDACAKSGWPERAELVMETMIAQGIKPNEITFGALVDSWAQQGRLKEAFAVIERMVTQYQVAPNSVLIGGLIDACRRSRETQHVTTLWEIVVKYNLRPSKIFYPQLMAMAVMENDVRVATEVLLHAYARGFLRRAALNSEDPALHAIACAMVYYRHEIVCTGRIEQASMKKAVARVKTVFKSIAMSEAAMDQMPTNDALKFCLTWGDAGTKSVLGYRHRNGSRKDRKGIFRKDSTSSAAARRAKDVAAAKSN